MRLTLLSCIIYFVDTWSATVRGSLWLTVADDSDVSAGGRAIVVVATVSDVNVGVVLVIIVVVFVMID